MSTEHSVSYVTEHETDQHASDVTERETDQTGQVRVNQRADREQSGALTAAFNNVFLCVFVVLKWQDGVVEREGVFRSALRHLFEFWPLRMAGRAFQGFLWLLGFRTQKETAPDAASVSSPARQSLSGRKRLHPVTRLLLSVLPRWAQSTLGYPVSSSIGRTLSPEVGTSPTKPCGKGSKRKQDELDDDEEEQQTWVEVLTQELPDKDNPEEDPDYEPSTIETESEEYRSHNDTESDLEVSAKGSVFIEDVDTNEPVPV
ncbi:oogenesis-related [Thalassophryne amazonica]|uniref:oogenesis-related n=1 Tax=Thalassophryne amazonica TaxID=390379 RepID=UPI0014722528|nr:oogenesis-related [Thalassophryne amazonica]